MRLWLRSLAATTAFLAVLTVAAVACAETCTLELKRVDRQNPNDSDYAVRVADPQRLFVQIGKDNAPLGNQASVAAFKRIIKKEPKYQTANPFRGTVTLGSQPYAFALDAIPQPSKEKKGDAEKKKEAKAKSAGMTFNRLYFDANHNGDLTDDKPLDAEPPDGPMPTGAFFRFPRVDLTVDAGNTKVEYSFVMEGSGYTSPSLSYVQVMLKTAAYREGYITLDGKKRHVILVDVNSNGRFDDAMSVSKDFRTGGGRIPVQPGDMLLIDPKEYVEASMHYVSKLANIDGRFYDVKTSVAGDKLTLTPSAVPLGKVKNPNAKYRATIYGDQGFIDVCSQKGEAVSVPVGQWKLFSYTIDATQAKKPKKADAKKSEEKGEKKEKNSALESLGNELGALLGGSLEGETAPRQSTVSAQATDSYKPVTVVKGETVELPFGPPYTPVVTADFFEDDEKNAGKKSEMLSLGLTLIGSAGEICDDMTVKDGHPSKPRFTITDAKGTVVERGSFEYG